MNRVDGETSCILWENPPVKEKFLQKKRMQCKKPFSWQNWN